MLNLQKVTGLFQYQDLWSSPPSDTFSGIICYHKLSKYYSDQQYAFLQVPEDWIADIQ